MAQLVRAEHDLPSLRIAYQDGGRVAVCFWLVRGDAEPELVATCPVAELGPIDFPDEVTVTDDQFSLPSDVMFQLSRRMPDLGPSDSPPDNALWLELVSPRGYLHLVPWEQLLSPLGRPLVRLPNYTVRPQAQSPTIEVALCASSTVFGGEFDVPATLARLARLWLTMSGKRTRVHLFCDGWAYEEVASLAGEVAGMAGEAGGLLLADPTSWEEVAHPSSMVTNPWLEWIGGALEGLALDVVHLVGYGYLSGGRGSLALAATPTSRVGEPATFVGAAQLAQFVAGRGAWTFLVSGPPDNYSGAALRDVADTLAINSPGISIAHDLGQDPDVSQLTRVVELVFDGKESVTEPLPGICAWAHPKFVEYPEENLITRSGHSAMVGEATREVLNAPDTPASVASGTRYLESLQAQWSASQGGAIDADAVAALRRVSDVLERRSVDLRGES